MKYYKTIENGIITTIGSGFAIHDTQTEITKGEYDILLAVIQGGPEDTFESVYELKESGIYEARERSEDEKIDWFVQVVQIGTVALEDVPEEYRSEVKSRIEPEQNYSDDYLAGYDQAILDMMGV